MSDASFAPDNFVFEAESIFPKYVSNEQYGVSDTTEVMNTEDE